MYSSTALRRHTPIDRVGAWRDRDLYNILWAGRNTKFTQQPESNCSDIKKLYIRKHGWSHNHFIWFFFLPFFQPRWNLWLCNTPYPNQHSYPFMGFYWLLKGTKYYLRTNITAKNIRIKILIHITTNLELYVYDSIIIDHYKLFKYQINFSLFFLIKINNTNKSHHSLLLISFFFFIENYMGTTLRINYQSLNKF